MAPSPPHWQPLSLSTRQASGTKKSVFAAGLSLWVTQSDNHEMHGKNSNNLDCLCASRYQHNVRILQCRIYHQGRRQRSETYSVGKAPATLKPTWCYRRAVGTSAKIFRHCVVTGFPNFTFIFHINRLLDYMTGCECWWATTDTDVRTAVSRNVIVQYLSCFCFIYCTLPFFRWIYTT